MRSLVSGLLGLSLFLSAGCNSPKPKDLIVGKWLAVEPKEAKDSDLALEFGSNERMNVAFGQGLAFAGKYRVTADDLVEMELESTKDTTGVLGGKKYKVTITKDILSLTPQEGEPKILKFRKQ
jgi:hypothetical protein